MSTSQTISTEQLEYWLGQKLDFTLIDVLPKEFYDEEHIPGAQQACVYDVTFLSQVYAIQPDRQNDIVVTSSRKSRAASVAADKLSSAGYTNVYEFEGGTEEWKHAGHALEGNQSVMPEPILEERTLFVDLARSRLEWVGRNITGAHTGTIDLVDGLIRTRGGEATQASFVIDMHTLTDTDIRDEKLNQLLIAHLKSEDFFHVSMYPRAEFQITALDFIPAAPGNINCHVLGTLTLRGVTNEITFPAIIEKAGDGSIAVEAHFDIDRTRWNVAYGSGKYFEKLGKHLVYDDVSIHLKLVAR